MKRDFSGEIIFRTSRGGGKGGQHLNKVETKVELWFHVESSNHLTAEEKEAVIKRLKNRINQKGYLHLSCSAERSQLKNKKIVLARFHRLMEDALKKRKKRKKTRPGKKAIEARLKQKKQQAQKKETRKKPGME